MSIKLCRVDPSQNMARFYEIDLQPTLFGEFSVQRHWGRIGSAGQSKSHWYASEEIALHRATVLEIGKRRRGYSWGSRLIRAKSDDKQLIESIEETGISSC